MFIDRKTDVRRWDTEHEDETKPRFGPRLHRRGLSGLPVVNTKLGQGDFANFTVDDVIKTVRVNSYGDTPEEKGQEEMDNYLKRDKENPRRFRTASAVRK